MKIEQVELFPTTVTALPTVGSMPYGEPFRRKGCAEILMRVKPVNFLLNSTLINDCINRGRSCVVNLEKGTLFITEGEVTAIPVDCKLLWSKKP
jgi:hypothetical protein